MREALARMRAKPKAAVALLALGLLGLGLGICWNLWLCWRKTAARERGRRAPVSARERAPPRARASTSSTLGGGGEEAEPTLTCVAPPAAGAADARRRERRSRRAPRPKTSEAKPSRRGATRVPREEAEPVEEMEPSEF